MVPELAFFYGTLMTGFDRRRRLGMDSRMSFRGRGWIEGALFDLGLYPAAIPATGRKVHGEVFELIDPQAVLPALDEVEGYRPALILRWASGRRRHRVAPNRDQLPNACSRA